MLLPEFYICENGGPERLSSLSLGVGHTAHKEQSQNSNAHASLQSLCFPSVAKDLHLEAHDLVYFKYF